MRKKKKPTRSKSKGYLQYSNSSLRDAYNAVVEKKMSMYQASKQFHVPYMTLHDRVKGRIAMDTPMGRRAMLTVDQEEKLVEYFKHLISIGYGYSKNEFLQIVTDHAVHCGSRKKKGKVKVGKIWYYSFLKRHPDVITVRPHQRPSCASKSAISKYYDELEHFLNKHGLVNKQHATFCMDKVAIACEEIHDKQKGDNSDEESESATSMVNSMVVVIAAGNAAGDQLPPFFVFPGETKLPKVTDTTPGTSGCVSSVNWVDGDVLKKYLFEHFLPLARNSSTDDSLVLLYDGHKFPLFPGLMDWAQDKKLYLFPLPPHCSCVQKNTLSILSDFDDIYTQELQSYLRRGRVQDIDISKNTTCQISCQTYLKLVLPEELKSLFLKAGIIPLDPLAMPWPVHKHLNLDKTNVKSRVLKDQSSDDSDSSEDEGDSTPDIRLKPKRKIRVRNRSKKHQSDENYSNTDTKPKRVKKTQLYAPNSSTSCLEKEEEEEGLGDRGTSGSDYAYDSEASSGAGVLVFDEDDQKCCVCGKLEPPGLAGEVSIVIVEWVQCDSCSHWTHLRFCTKVGVVDSEEEFKCPHCAPPRREVV
ncbi:uncharacterized protein [Haliotis cracherodii]|uniref:uncharacterized protein n=1 Tax=Haliotis cracherodii TaxID=6455 RepID=UPI0039E84702